MSGNTLFVSRNLIGDALYISPALNEYHRQHPDENIGILTNSDHVADLYYLMGVPIAYLTSNDEAAAQWCTRFIKFDVGEAFALSNRKKIHLAEAYAEMIGVKIFPSVGVKGKYKYSYLKPIVQPVKVDFDGIPPDYSDCDGAILISMFSASCSSRKGAPPNKMLPWNKWAPIIRFLRSFGYPLRFIGGPNDRAPLDISEEEYLLGVNLNQTARIMQRARMLVTVDNGMSHLAASQELPTFLFYPLVLGTHYILPIGNPNLVYVHMNPVTLDMGEAMHALRQTSDHLIKRSRFERERREVEAQNGVGR
jgi:hypothetical protein